MSESLACLPAEIIEQILEHCPPADYLAALAASKLFQRNDAQYERKSRSDHTIVLGPLQRQGKTISAPFTNLFGAPITFRSPKGRQNVERNSDKTDSAD